MKTPAEYLSVFFYIDLKHGHQKIIHTISKGIEYFEWILIVRNNSLRSQK